MNHYFSKLKRIDSHRNESQYAERICSELIYLEGISQLHDNRYFDQIETAVDFLLDRIQIDGVITKDAVFSAEAMLSDLYSVAKSYTELFIAHAHIDMNWQWGYHETATVTVDTFRTMLDLMREYPEFTFAQSQASTYEIVEKYCPKMLDEIRKYVREGRWEVTAAEWVEPDKNMPSGESLTRQILEAKKYLTALLDISSDRIDIDFVPDTFGHAVTVPEILSDAGIRYLYHCRGGDGPCLYRYQAPSGKNILTYREYAWYNRNITPEVFETLPRFFRQEGMNTYLCVYGVGDHGGGPSRRDIERILEYRSWPLTPTIRFGTYHEFFEAAEKSGIDFPVIDKERNFLFSGCYTTQARIKMSNRISEARAFEAEALSVASSVVTGDSIAAKKFERPWRNILFNQFHDILPGSGTIETREYAMGTFQDTLAFLQVAASDSMRKIADCIDTSKIVFDDDRDSPSEGAGVGYSSGEVQRFTMPSAERGRGSTRVLHLFNPTAIDRDEVTELVVWDYLYDDAQTIITDDLEHPLDFCLVEDHKYSDGQYWGHSFKKYFVRVKVPAFGYTTVIVRQKPYELFPDHSPVTYEHTDHELVNNAPIVLENDKLCAVFDKTTARLISLTDRCTGEQLIEEPSCFFRYIEENPIHGLIAWRVGPYMKTVDLNETCAVRMTEWKHTELYSSMAYTLRYNASVISTTVMLKQGSSMLEFHVTVDWQETPVPNVSTPQLSFIVPVSYRTTGESLCEIPYGKVKREAAEFDIPTHGSLGICGNSNHIISLFAEAKYGFRLHKNMGQITLLRSAYEPDPHSDQGIHTMYLGVACCEENRIYEVSLAASHPISYVSGQYHQGTLGTTETFLKLSGNVRVSAVKPSEDGEGLILRIYEVDGKQCTATVKLFAPIVHAYLTDSNETIGAELEICQGKASVPVSPYSVQTIKLLF